MKRRSFVGLAATLAAAANAPIPALAQSPSIRTGRKALVLVGGANRGAYEAGAVQALADRQDARDGTPLDFDLVCGTSIGALNAYFIATAQYRALQVLWRGAIAPRNVFRVKAPYDEITNKYSGLLNRAAAAFQLASGLTSDVKGVLDPGPVHALLADYVDPHAPVHLPFYISTTNITRQANQLFVRRATTPDGLAKQAVNDDLLRRYPRLVRVVDDALLRTVLFASAAIPMLFDPILIPREGEPDVFDEYVDGGVTQNVPIDVAQRCADTIDVMLVDPFVHVDERYGSALDVGLGTFATMQSRILAYQIRLAYALKERHLPFTPYIVRPDRPLPGKPADFNDQAALEEMWRRGYTDMMRGWVSFVPAGDEPLDAPA